ncbi:hypothetical protein [Hydrogenophaga sp.]|uniref:hypothetical protein n=1 Tax=Hydrogenophaga sp. TaxID=1904254 RepID=UPI002FC5C816
MASQIQIINVALSRIGANEIQNLTPTADKTRLTAEQKLANSCWDIARQDCLRAHPWNFALKDGQLNQIDGYVGYQFKYAYQLPSDFIRLMQVYGNPTYKVQGRRILLNDEICKIKYVADIQDTMQWDASFTDVMAQRLAHDMGYALTKWSATQHDSMYTIYQQKLKAARYLDSTEDVQDTIGGHDSQYITVRS